MAHGRTVYRAVVEPRQAGLQQRCGVVGRQWPGAAGPRRSPGPGGESAPAGHRRAAAQGVANGRAHSSLETIEARPVFDEDELTYLDPRRTAPRRSSRTSWYPPTASPRDFSGERAASIRRVVRMPKRWDRIVEMAAHRRGTAGDARRQVAGEIPAEQQADDPVDFPDLSLSVIKLLGSGEYAVDPPGQVAPGHFGLAVKDYAHSTAPNRRFPDLITQRLLKAALAGKPAAIRRDEAGGTCAALHRAGGHRHQGRASRGKVGGRHAAGEDRASVRRRSSPAPPTRGRGCGSSSPGGRR